LRPIGLPLYNPMPTANEIDAFLYEGQYLRVSSEWIAGFKYKHDEQLLDIDIKGYGPYTYSQVTPEEATQLVQAGSHGHEVWEVLYWQGRYAIHKPGGSRRRRR
jgi:hypothetical protein